MIRIIFSSGYAGACAAVRDKLLAIYPNYSIFISPPSPSQLYSVSVDCDDDRWEDVRNALHFWAGAAWEAWILKQPNHKSILWYDNNFR